MRTRRVYRATITAGLFCGLGVTSSLAQQTGREPAKRDSSFRLSQATGRETKTTVKQERTPNETKSTVQVEERPSSETTTVRVTEETQELYGYREVSDFFNVREANSSVHQGEWEFETAGAWVTISDGSDDDVSLSLSLKYGITDDLFVELEVLPINFGDGGEQGNGDLALIVFNRFIRETEQCPAVAAWAEMRIPSGDGSSGVDGTFHGNITKSIINPCFRVHFEGFVETANGNRGAEGGGGASLTSRSFFFGSGETGGEDRRHFQWGLGPGFDYQFDDKTLGLVNYINHSSEEEGHHNQNILEFGIVRELNPCQHLKAAVDVGLDGAEETPNLAAKILWSIDFP
jgi:hypothetical protein